MRIHHRLLILLTLALTACASPRPAERRPWIVGSDLANPPFAWVDETNVPRGRDVEMAVHLADHMGVQLIFERVEFADLLDRLERGELHAVIATLGATPERAERVLLSEPYFRTELLVLVRQGEGEPRLLSDLAGRRVSAGIGTTSERALRNRLPDAIAAEPSAKGDSSLERLLSGEVDALIMDGPDAIDFVRERPDELMVLEEPVATENYVVAVVPGGEEWLHKINQALAEIRASGALDRLDRKYGLQADVE